MRNLLFALLLLPLMASCVKDTAQVTLDSLLDEMICRRIRTLSAGAISLSASQQL